MKTYELVYLNKGLKFSRDKDLEQAQEIINMKASEGWELLQIVSPNDLAGALVAVFYMER